MDLDISARSSLTATLLDPVTGLPGSEAIGVNFASSLTQTLSGIVSILWVPVSAKVLEVDTSAELDVTFDTVSGPFIQTVQDYAGGDVAWVQNMDWFEVALVADPLAVDAYGNPIAASRASELTITIKDASAVTRGVATLAVTRAGQVAIYRHTGKLPSTAHITNLAVSGVTATACKLYLIFGADSAT